MRPLDIRMSAFGPYAGYIDIPMEELGEHGLYLITGDTGAGKTTIFDAICFALFGEASGENRDASMFRSKYADEDTPTEVELRFSHEGKEYTVKRNPEYIRPSKKGDGYTKQVADAELHLPNGKVVTKLKSVTQEIESILGINKDQFSQIAMLAQGDFMKLLLADTKDRMEIFRELFKTQNYRSLQKRLDDEAKSVHGELADSKKSIEQYIAGVQVEKDDVLSIDVKTAIAGNMTAEAVVELLDKLTDQDKVLKNKLDTELEKINRNLEKVNNAIGAAEAYKKAKEALEKAEKQLEKEEPGVDEKKALFDETKKDLENRDALKKKAAQIEAELPNYDALDAMNEDIEKTTNYKIAQKDSLDKEEENRDKEQAALGELKKELYSIKDTSAEAEKLKNTLEKLNVEAESLDELSENLDEYFNEKDSFTEAQETYLERDNEFNIINAAYEAMEKRFRDGQAGILAEKLKEGEKCPVCGSTKHPQLAHLSDEVPTERELNAEKKKADAARKAREESANVAGGLKKALEEKEKSLKKLTKKQLMTDDLVKAHDTVKDTIGKCAEKYRKTADLIEKYGEQLKRKEKLEKDIPIMEARIKSSSDTVEALKASVASAESKLKESEKHLMQLKKGLSFESKKTARAEAKKLNDQADELQKKYDAADKALKEQKETVVKLKAEIAGHKKTIEDSKSADLNAETEKKEMLDAEQKECISRGRAVASRIDVNDRIRANILKMYDEAAKTEKKLQWIRALADTANGRLNGKEKIMLETYIQMTYFDRIINRANLRFMTMSAGQYELVRMREADNAKSQSGLELNVIDHYNGSERSVKTLSGGESFMASLSLALGLSDEIQSAAGGIQIDTMFVDEGFGSLDPEALDKAYKALAGLIEGNRLVGIISHVADLKERIDMQIVVTKEKSGGSFIELRNCS